VAAKRNGKVRPPRAIRREIPAELDAAVLACLEVDPEARPTAEALALRLADGTTAVLPGESVPAPPAIEARPARRVFRARRRPGRLGAAAVALAAAAVLLVLVETGGSASPPPSHPVRTPSGSTPVEHAHNLAHWIRGHTG
jgi:hypothetical protein